ncbi:MAG TPA: RluA family pseudouridine synthase [Acidobacteriota bacterium]
MNQRPASAYKQFQVRAPELGWTLQRVLHDRLQFSHAQARGLLARGCVFRNGWAQRDAAIRMSLGDQVEVRYDPSLRYSAPKRSEYRALEAGDFVAGGRVLHVDEALVVVDKPSGLLSVHAPGTRSPDLKRRLELRLGRLFPVQRLDRYTSGVLAYARSRAAKEALLPQFRDHTVLREYVGVVLGRPEPSSRTLRSSLMEDRRSLKVRPIRSGETGEEAVTEVELLQALGSVSLCRFRLQTGKKHQIRVQMAAIGHPLLGDRAYGRPSPALARPALHAAALELSHPLSGKRMRWESAPPADFQRLLKQARSGALQAGEPAAPARRSRVGTRQPVSRGPRRNRTRRRGARGAG